MTFAFDGGDLIAIVVALIIPLASIPFVIKRSNDRSRSEVVDADVLAQFATLFERIGKLEALVAQQQISLDNAYTEIREMKRLEEYLNAKVHERDKQIADLKDQLVKARERIRHLEMVCKRAGINGDILDESDCQ